jgi:RNA polymerase sigma factor (TIGR02999 family)
MTEEVSFEIRALMGRFRSGDPEAAGALVGHLYPELHRIASAKMRYENPDHTWTPTVLVNELYLELVKIRALRTPGEDTGERDAFLRLAGFIMRRLLIHHARPLHRKAQKVEPMELDRERRPLQDGVESLMQVEQLLSRLSKVDPRLRTLVELRVFEGKTVEDAADNLGVSRRTAHKYWNFARLWLSREMGESGDPVQ